MTRRLLISYLSLAVVVLAMLEVPLGFVNARSERAQLTAKVERDAVTIASLAESTLEGDAPASSLPAIEALGRRYTADTRCPRRDHGPEGCLGRRLGSTLTRRSRLCDEARVPGGASR